MRRGLPHVLAALVAASAVLAGLDAPLVDDTLFWWVPKALLVAQDGPSWILADALPTAARPDLALPHQWSGGLPDYGHPPLWYHWLGAWLWLLGPTHHAVHIACVLPAMFFGAGLAALLGRMARHAAWGASAIVLLPPVIAQLQRADTDLPLMTFGIWALVAIIDRRDLAFAVFAGLATASKEPGVLLVAPFLAGMVVDRRWSAAWLAPLTALGAWAVIHHAETGWWLAGAERLPGTAGDWIQDLGHVAWLMIGDQGRWLLIPLMLFGLWRTSLRHRVRWILLAQLTTQWLFYGTLNFLGGIDRTDHYTHVRYLLPGTITAACLLVAPLPLISIPVLLATSILYLRTPSPWGPEASLAGIDAAHAIRASLDHLDALDGPIWVGSYTAAALTRPYAGVVDQPRINLSIYGPETDPAHVSGYVIETRYGEPLGRIQELELVEYRVIRAGGGQVRILEAGQIIHTPPEP